MTKRRWMMLGLLVAALPACSSMGMDRGPITALAPDEAVVIDDARIAEALERQPQLPEQVRVGVWFRDPPDATWRWTFEDRQRVIRASETVDRVDLFPISRGFVEADDLVSLRLAAARHGAHAILVLEGRPEQESSDNAWLATYPLILPIFFAPAAELDTRFAIDAQMYDVRNGFLYLTAESEALEEQQRAHIWIDHAGAIRDARARAVEDLESELRDRLTHLLGEGGDAAVARATPEAVEAVEADESEPAVSERPSEPSEPSDPSL